MISVRAQKRKSTIQAAEVETNLSVNNALDVSCGPDGSIFSPSLLRTNYVGQNKLDPIFLLIGCLMKAEERKKKRK